jgi:uncharacterized membrane protein YgcG
MLRGWRAPQVVRPRAWQNGKGLCTVIITDVAAERLDTWRTLREIVVTDILAYRFCARHALREIIVAAVFPDHMGPALNRCRSLEAKVARPGSIRQARHQESHRDQCLVHFRFPRRLLCLDLSYCHSLLNRLGQMCFLNSVHSFSGAGSATAGSGSLSGGSAMTGGGSSGTEPGGSSSA